MWNSFTGRNEPSRLCVGERWPFTGRQGPTLPLLRDMGQLVIGKLAMLPWACVCRLCNIMLSGSNHFSAFTSRKFRQDLNLNEIVRKNVMRWQMIIGNIGLSKARLSPNKLVVIIQSSSEMKTLRTLKYQAGRLSKEHDIIYMTGGGARAFGFNDSTPRGGIRIATAFWRWMKVDRASKNASWFRHTPAMPSVRPVNIWHLIPLYCRQLNDLYWVFRFYPWGSIWGF